jgi:hypothetical protein
MSYLSLSDIAGQSETTEAQAPTLTLDDLNQLSEADGQKPPTVDGADVTSPSAPAVVPPTDRVIDPLLSGVFGQNNREQTSTEARQTQPDSRLTQADHWLSWTGMLLPSAQQQCLAPLLVCRWTVCSLTFQPL